MLTLVNLVHLREQMRAPCASEDCGCGLYLYNLRVGGISFFCQWSWRADTEVNSAAQKSQAASHAYAGTQPGYLKAGGTTAKYINAGVSQPSVVWGGVLLII